MRRTRSPARSSSPRPRPSIRPPPSSSARRRTAPATSSRSAAAPDVVSASHTHHDYPAADIAAPMGSPLYALADSVVAPLVEHARRPLRHRPDAAGLRRPGLDVLPSLGARLEHRAGRRAQGGRAGRSRRCDRARHRAAPPSPAPARVSRGRSRRRGSSRSPARPSPGRTPARTTPRRWPSSVRRPRSVGRWRSRELLRPRSRLRISSQAEGRSSRSFRPPQAQTAAGGVVYFSRPGS